MSTRRAWAKGPLKSLLSAAWLGLVACGGGSFELPQAPHAVRIEFRMRAAGPEMAFFFQTTDPALIDRVAAQLALPASQRSLFPSGAIAAGDAGVNAPWGWHFVDLELVEVAIELCDGNPALVQADLGYWLGTVGRFCPWGGHVHDVQAVKG